MPVHRQVILSLLVISTPHCGPWVVLRHSEARPQKAQSWLPAKSVPPLPELSSDFSGSTRA